MRKPSLYKDRGYSDLAAKDLGALAERMFAVKNYALAVAAFEMAGATLTPIEAKKLSYARAHINQGDPRFSTTAAILPILQYGYCGATIADVLDVEPANGTAEKALQVIYRPSFDPEAILSLTLVGGQTTLSFDVASCNLWGAATLARDPEYARKLPLERLPLGLSVHRERIAFEHEDAASLWGRIAEVSLDVEAREARALDGMRVEVCLRDGRAFDSDVHVYSGGPGVELSKILIQIASERSQTPESVAALENLVGYFPDSGLPVKVRRGTPTVVRIFGRLGSSDNDVQVLREILSGISADELLVVDLSNFRSMGQAFYPEFALLVQRPGPTAWVRSSSADKYLRELPLNSASVFETLAAAQLYVRAAI